MSPFLYSFFTPLHSPPIVAIGYFGFETRIGIIWHRAKPNIGHASVQRNVTLEPDHKSSQHPDLKDYCQMDKICPSLSKQKQTKQCHQPKSIREMLF